MTQRWTLASASSEYCSRSLSTCLNWFAYGWEWSSIVWRVSIVCEQRLSFLFILWASAKQVSKMYSCMYEGGWPSLGHKELIRWQSSPWTLKTHPPQRFTFLSLVTPSDVNERAMLYWRMCDWNCFPSDLLLLKRVNKASGGRDWSDKEMCPRWQYAVNSGHSNDELQIFSKIQWNAPQNRQGTFIRPRSCRWPGSV